MMKRLEVQILRRAGHSQAEVSKLTGVAERTIRTRAKLAEPGCVPR